MFKVFIAYSQIIAMHLNDVHRAFSNIRNAHFQYSQWKRSIFARIVSFIRKLLQCNDMVFFVYSQIFVMQVFNIRKDLLLYSRLDAMQLIGFLRVFATIRNASVRYAQGFLPLFANSCNAIKWFSSCIRKYSQRTFSVFARIYSCIRNFWNSTKLNTRRKYLII